MNKEIVQLRNEDILGSNTFRRVEANSGAVNEIYTQLTSHVIGQDEAALKLSKAVVRSRAELGRKEQPMGVFFLLGLTGTGKTEMSKALAKTMTQGSENWQDHYVKVDCSEMQHSHDIARLAGSPPGYVGYGNEPLITPDKLNKGAVVCFDEIEKANDSVIRWLLPVLEEGKTKIFMKQDGEVKPTTLDFSRTMILMTSNVGAEALQNRLKGKAQIGFSQTANKAASVQETGKQALEDHFRHMPEFIGRIGAEQIIAFNELGKEQYIHIFENYLRTVNDGQKQDPHFLAATEEARDYIISQATNPQFGARDLISTINNLFISQAAEVKASGVLAKDAPLIAVLEEDETGEKELSLYTSEIVEADPQPQAAEIIVFERPPYEHLDIPFTDEKPKAETPRAQYRKPNRKHRS